MKAYKGFDKNMRCRDFQYEVDAAHKREVATTKESLGVGNAAKLREALNKMCHAVFDCIKFRKVSEVGDMAIALDKAKAALAEPPRQCDVGTAAQQEERCWRHYLRSEGAMACPTVISGALKWAQMPYEEGENNG